MIYNRVYTNVYNYAKAGIFIFVIFVNFYDKTEAKKKSLANQQNGLSLYISCSYQWISSTVNLTETDTDTGKCRDRQKCIYIDR